MCALSVFAAGVGHSVIAQITDTEYVDVTAVVPSQTPPGGGGGSGSSGSQIQRATVIMSGSSFPGAKLTLLKDGQVATTLIANNDGTFQITINNLTYGNYQLSLIAEDSSGVGSSPYTLNVAAFTTTPYIYTNILLPPTITANSTSVQLGSPYKISGYSAPGSTVTLENPGIAVLGSAIADGRGRYEIEANASRTPATYFLRAIANMNGLSSPFSKPIQIDFYAGQGQPVPPPQYSTCVDYNGDRRVNLIDFSILLFWIDTANPPKNIDCNGDGLINIKDFSVLMYFWTG